MRGLAILLVVFYHNFGFINYFFFGWLGVDLFFVLSGYLITNILVSTQQHPNFLRQFYIRRTLRIFPVYYLALVIFLTIFPILRLNVAGLPYFLNNQIWLWTYLQNWLFIAKPPGNNLLLTHLWSLAVEEQFYLIWPFVILIVKRAKVLFVFMLALLVTVIALRYFLWIYKIENFAYFNLYTFSRIDGICIGSMLALLRTFNKKGLKKFTPAIVFTLAGLNFLFYFFNKKTQFTLPFMAIVGYTTFAVLFALLVNEGVEGKSKVISIIFNNKILKFFGKISYSLYVFHWPLHLLILPYIMKWISISLDQRIYVLIVSASLTTLAGILLSILSYRYFERYFIRLKGKLS
jgi:peptidoglycan/LPS O-acetylase OafA/YrhL